MMERTWGKRNISPLLVGVQTGTATSEISMESPQKLGLSLPQDAAISPLDIPKKFSITPRGHVLNYVHISIIHNSQNVETT